MTAAILLAGGRATRLDGQDKTQLVVGGATLLQHARDAVAGCTPVIVAGDPVDAITGVRWVREEPRFGGPVAAIVAALRADAWDDEWTVVLACDLPHAERAVARLLRDIPLLPRDTDGVCLGDASSRPQWLTGVYRTVALRRAAEAMPAAGAGAAMRDLLADMDIAVFAAPDDETDDVDTWEDLERARARDGGPSIPANQATANQERS